VTSVAQGVTSVDLQSSIGAISTAGITIQGPVQISLSGAIGTILTLSGKDSHQLLSVERNDQQTSGDDVRVENLTMISNYTTLELTGNRARVQCIVDLSLSLSVFFLHN